MKLVPILGIHYSVQCSLLQHFDLMRHWSAPLQGLICWLVVCNARMAERIGGSCDISFFRNCCGKKEQWIYSKNNLRGVGKGDLNIMKLLRRWKWGVEPHQHTFLVAYDLLFYPVISECKAFFQLYQKLWPLPFWNKHLSAWSKRYKSFFFRLP